MLLRADILKIKADEKNNTSSDDSLFIRKDSKFGCLIGYKIEIKCHWHLLFMSLVNSEEKLVGSLVTHPNSIFKGDTKNNVLDYAMFLFENIRLKS